MQFARVQALTGSLVLVQGRKRAAKASSYLGVSWHKSSGKWRVHVVITRGGKRVFHNGHLHTDEAAAARQADE